MEQVPRWGGGRQETVSVLELTLPSPSPNPVRQDSGRGNWHLSYLVLASLPAHQEHPPLGLKFMPSQAPRLWPSELCRCSQINTFSISSRMDRTAPPAGHKGGPCQDKQVSLG
jgi:hypothetical protein